VAQKRELMLACAVRIRRFSIFSFALKLEELTFLSGLKGCPCLNGPFQIVIAQLLVFVGKSELPSIYCMDSRTLSICTHTKNETNIACITNSGLWFSFATLIDCSFVTIEDMDNDFFPIANFTSVGERGIGFYFFEDQDGDCYFYDDDVDADTAENIFDDYFDFLGSSWVAGRVLGVS
jgi:hypothetical protein